MQSTPLIIGINGRVRAIDVQNGKDLWTANLKGSGWSPVETIVEDGIVYACSGTKLFALRLTTGEVCYKVRHDVVQATIVTVRNGAPPLPGQSPRTPSIGAPAAFSPALPAALPQYPGQAGYPVPQAAPQYAPATHAPAPQYAPAPPQYAPAPAPQYSAPKTESLYPATEKPGACPVCGQSGFPNLEQHVNACLERPSPVAAPAPAPAPAPVSSVPTYMPGPAYSAYPAGGPYPAYAPGMQAYAPGPVPSPAPGGYPVPAATGYPTPVPGPAPAGTAYQAYPPATVSTAACHYDPPQPLGPTDMLLLAGKGYVYGFNKLNGVKLWTCDLKGSGFNTVQLLVNAGPNAQPTLLASSNGHLFCLDVMTGAILWKNGLKGLGHGTTSFTVNGQRSHGNPVY